MEYIIYNPFAWIAIFWLSVMFLSHTYWYCKKHIYFAGSWKELDKSIHWRK